MGLFGKSAKKQRKITNERVHKAFEKKKEASAAELMSLVGMCCANVMYAAENYRVFTDDDSRRTLLYDASESVEFACILIEEIISRLEKSRNVYSFEPRTVGEEAGSHDADQDRKDR